MNLHTVKCFAKAIIHGSKYVYQTVPRLLTIWLDMGENVTSTNAEVFKKLNGYVANAIKLAPAYKVRHDMTAMCVGLAMHPSGLQLSPKLFLVLDTRTTRSMESCLL